MENSSNKTFKTEDGLTLSYQVVGEGARWMILANGLGGRLSSWGPLIDGLRSDFKFITWDYRGLFGSQNADDLHLDLSVRRHAEDLLSILDAEGVREAVFCGWSMGVQVALEAAYRSPDRADRLILLNGTHGHALETGFQPVFRVPFFSKYLNEVIEAGLESRFIREAVCSIPNHRGFQKYAGWALERIWDNPKFSWVVATYCDDVFNETNFPNLLRLFQELNAHSVYHFLRHVTQPALVLSGGMDVLTPAYQSKEMARKLPNSRWINYPLASHFLLQEKPRQILAEIRKFI
ncbi:MAG: alpha/beta hydrolase [Bdellovibrionota bacterium]